MYLSTDSNSLLRDLIHLTECVNCLLDVVEGPRYLKVVFQRRTGRHALAHVLRIGIDVLLDCLLLL